VVVVGSFSGLLLPVERRASDIWTIAVGPAADASRVGRWPARMVGLLATATVDGAVVGCVTVRAAWPVRPGSVMAGLGARAVRRGQR
jgi:hypothetical protein